MLHGKNNVMRRICAYLVMLAMLLCMCSGCESDTKPKPQDTGDKQNTTANSSDNTEDTGDNTQSSDTVISDGEVTDSGDTATSDETDTQLNLEGQWYSKKDGKVYALSFNTEMGKCVYAQDENTLHTDYTLEEDKIIIEDVGEFSVRLEDKKLVLADSENETEITFKRFDDDIKLKKADFIGAWECNITSTDDDSEVKIAVELREDGSCNVVQYDDNTNSDGTDATWSLKKGVLILDNGSGSDDGKLKFTVLRVYDDILILDIGGYAVNFAEKK